MRAQLRLTDIFILIHPNDNVAILTKDGEFYGIMGASEEEIRQNADLIEEEMTKAVKNPECQKGFWLFKIKRHWCEIEGHLLPVTEVDGEIQLEGHEDGDQ